MQKLLPSPNLAVALVAAAVSIISCTASTDTDSSPESLAASGEALSEDALAEAATLASERSTGEKTDDQGAREEPGEPSIEEPIVAEPDEPITEPDPPEEGAETTVELADGSGTAPGDETIFTGGDGESLAGGGVPYKQNSDLPPSPARPIDILPTVGNVQQHSHILPARSSRDGRLLADNCQSPYRDVCLRLAKPEVVQVPFSETNVLASTGESALRITSDSLVAKMPGTQLANPRLVHRAVCDASAVQPSACGVNDCYDVTLVAFVAGAATPGGEAEEYELWSFPLHVEVASPKTAGAGIVSVTVPANGTRSPVGKHPRLLEPTISDDGRLLVYHGTASNLMYAVNSDPAIPACRADGWKVLNPVSSMATDPKMAPYPISKHKIRDSEGRELAPGENLMGSYPWIQGNGANLFFSAAHAPFYSKSGKTWVPRYPLVGAPPPSQSETTLVSDNAQRIGLSWFGSWSRGKVLAVDSRLNNADMGMQPNQHRSMNLYSDMPQGVEVGETRIVTINSFERRFAYERNLLPSDPRELVWFVQTDNATDEIPFDDHITDNALIVAPMNASISNQETKYNDGYVDGQGFTATPRFQNAASSRRWNMPAYGTPSGNATGGPRVEPIAAGGIRGKGVFLRQDDAITFKVPAQTAARTTEMADAPWLVHLAVDPRSGLASGTRRLVTYPDGSFVNLVGGAPPKIQVGIGSTTYSVGLPGAIQPAARRFTQLSFVSQKSGANTRVQIFVDGYLLSSILSNKSLLRVKQGNFVLGKSGTTNGVAGWLDDFKVIQDLPSPEVVCNHAYGTLVGTNESAGPRFQRASLYPSASHQAVSALLTPTRTTFARYVCETPFLAEPRQCIDRVRGQKPAPAGNPCVRDAILFPQGPLYANRKRPNTQGNAFCTSCHSAGDPVVSMRPGMALSLGTVNLDQDPRRQPVMSERLLFGNIPLSMFGLTGQVTAPPAGLAIDGYVFGNAP